jgi:hypothetical protein
VKAPCSRTERGKDLVFSATNKSFPKGAVGGVCALNQPDLCQFFMDDIENSLFAVLTEHVRLYPSNFAPQKRWPLGATTLRGVLLLALLGFRDIYGPYGI